MSKLGFDNDTSFELVSDTLKPIVVDEPKNWNQDNKTYEKDLKGGGTLLKTNTVLEFRKDGYDFLKSHLLGLGFGSQIEVNKTGKDETALNERWRSLYRSKLDLLNAKFKTNSVEVSFTQGGLYDAIIARYTDTYDLVSEKSADNLDITPLETIKEQVTGRAIEKKSQLEVRDGDRETLEVQGGDDDIAKAVPFDVVTNSDRDFINGITPGANQANFGSGNYARGQTGHMLYDRSDRIKKLILKGKVRLEIIDTRSGTLDLDLVRYDFQNDEYVFKSKETLETGNPGQSLGVLEYDFDNEEVYVEENESIAIILHLNLRGSGKRKVIWEYSQTKLEIKIDDIYPPTESLNLLPHEQGDRLLEKITGEKGLFYSKTFGRKELGYDDDGEWSLLSTTSGFWARGFDLGEPIVDTDGETIPKKQYNISLSNWFESYSVVQPLYWGIEVQGGKEFFRCENYDFVNQDFVGVKLGRTVRGQFQYITASNFEETVLTGELFTGVSIGFQKGGSQYEEVIGLSSLHGKAEYNTSLKLKENNVYSKVSFIRADVEGHELARIKQGVFTPDEDTEYDQDIFFRDLIKSGTGYRLRSYEDDFEGTAINGIKGGIYSPETTGNLRLTPFRCLLRNARKITTGLYPEPEKFLTFISSNCFSSVIIDGLKEDGAIKNKDLGEPYIDGWLLTFEGKVYQEMIDQLEGFTWVEGERVPNWYGLFEAQKPDGEVVRGRIIKSSINGNGQHEIARVL